MGLRRVGCALVIVCLASLALAAEDLYVPHRVFVSGRKAFADFETLLADVAAADVAFVGEQHDDPNTHRLELELLQGLARRRGDVALSLEMFERDIQEPMAHFLMGHVPEQAFLAEARPWPNYATDYKPLVDFAISKDWAVVAANVPRSIAAEVAKSGLDALKTKPDAEKAWFAKDLQCPTGDKYYKRFEDAMGGHEGTTPASAAKGPDNFYLAQCLKDETMAESIAQSYAAGAIGGKRPLVVSINGSFHSDYGDGTASRTRRRLPGKRVVVLTIQPVANLDTLKPDGDARKRADYLLYTIGKGS